jgi:ubiquinone/menaquinone biosynthesis C-methylase UbiE
MSALLPFEPRRFRSTVPYYATYRPAYPDRLIAMVAADLRLTPSDRLLDLGCGPGQLAIAFAPFCRQAVAMDPEPEMLEAAALDAAQAGVEVTLVEGSSFDLAPKLGTFRLVTMGRSFHWMDRAATLTNLEAMVVADGGLALFDEQAIGRSTVRWREIMQDTIAKFSTKPSTREARSAANWQSHEEVLLQSAFRTLYRFGVISRRAITTDAIVGRAYSMSSGSPDALGQNRAEFEAVLRRQLGDLQPDGRFEEIVEMRALIARRTDSAR